jgi:N6-adenosine-specific RNA methylase IME4
MKKENKFNVILADPPWQFKTHSEKGLEGRPQHYKRMSHRAICNLPLDRWAAKDCWLFMWTTGVHYPQALEVMKAWGFKFSGSGFVWVKLNKNAKPFTVDRNGERCAVICNRDFFMGGGYTTRKNAEFCIIGRRGRAKRKNADIHEIIIAPRREHSRKPDEQYSRIERFADGPYLELFSRNRRKGWKMLGNEAGKFA